MIYLESDQTDPYWNLATEEYLFKTFETDEPIFFLWQNANTIVVGRNQNTFEEINPQYVHDHHVNVVRRLTGGGAVFHDLGNLNYTFITENHEHDFDFSPMTQPVIQTLSHLGIPAELTGRNDLTIRGKKFSGNAQARTKTRLLHHGTLLFRTSIDDVCQALNVQMEKFQSKAVTSVRSRVTNIADHLPKDCPIQTVTDFQRRLREEIACQNAPHWHPHPLTPQEHQQIQELADQKYRTWDWNYGKSPKFDFKSSRRFPWGKLEICLNIANGIIQDCAFYGDFFALQSPQIIAHRLTGSPLDADTLQKTLTTSFLQTVFPALTQEEFFNLLFA